MLFPRTLDDVVYEYSSRSFAIGLGPIPFVMIPDVSPTHARFLPSFAVPFSYSPPLYRLSRLSRLLLFHSIVCFLSLDVASGLTSNPGIANFIVGLAFLPLRNFLAGGDMLKEGRIFYVFVILLFSSTFMLSRMYRG